MKRTIDWKGIQTLVENGVPYKIVSDRFKVNEPLIRKRASLGKWATPNRVQERIEGIKIKKLIEENGKLIEESKNGIFATDSQEENLDLIAKTWLDRAEDHRLMSYKIAKRGLKQAMDKEIPVLDWSDVEKIDKLGRRSVGLDGNEGNLSVNIGLQLVNSRIETDDLPLDAVVSGE